MMKTSLLTFYVILNLVVLFYMQRKKNTPHSILTVYVSQLLCLTSDFLASDTTAVDSGLYSARDPTRICVKNITVWFTLY